MESIISFLCQTSLLIALISSYSYIKCLSVQADPIKSEISSDYPMLICCMEILISPDFHKGLEDIKGLRSLFHSLYNSTLVFAVLFTILMHLCSKSIIFTILYLFLSCATMENLNIHESQRANANGNNLSPEELLDCCLIGKMLTNKPVRFKAMRDWLSTLWEPSNKVTISLIEENRFMFQFYHYWDMERIFQGGPWLFDNHMVVLRKLAFGENPTTVSIDTADIWVQVHQLPYGFMNEQVGMLIGSHLGRSIKYDDTNNYSPWRKYMRLRVAINTQEPLKKEWSFDLESGVEVKVFFKYEKLGNFCFVCGIMGHTESSCSKKYEPTYAATEKQWGNFLRAENSNPGGSAVPNKWLRGGQNIAAAGQTVSINNNWKHSLFGRVKVVCDPKTKKMSFLMAKTDAEISARTSETQWVPIIFNDQNKQAAEGSNNNSVPRKQDNNMIIVENVRAVQEIRENGRSFFSKAPVLLEPTGPVSYMPIQTRNRQVQGNTNNQLAILHAEITNPGTQTEGQSSQMAKNEGTGGIPKKRLRLEGGLEDRYEGIGDTNMQEEEPITAKEGDGLTTVHDNPLFSANTVKAGPAKQACLKK